MEVGEQGSISVTFYEQLLHMQIQKAQKNTGDLTVIFALLESALVKAARKTLVKLTLADGLIVRPDSNFLWNAFVDKTKPLPYICMSNCVRGYLWFPSESMCKRFK